MTQPFPCKQLERDFARMIGRTPKPDAPIPMDQEAGTTLAQPAPRPITPDATPVAPWPKNGGHEL